MTPRNYFFSSTIAFAALFVLTAAQCMAAALPLAGVDIIAKNIASGRIISSITDKNGNFSAGSIENGEYYIFVGNESLPPVKTSAKNGTVSGRVVILTGETTTTEPSTATPAKAVGIVKKSLPVPAKKTKTFIAPLLRQ